MRRAVLAAIFGVIGTASQATECAVDAPCDTANGSYVAALPEGAPTGAVVFLHGWGSSGAGSLKLTGMVQSFTDAGYAVIAPNGTPRDGRTGYGWSFHPDRPGPRGEIAFLAEVKADAAARFGFDAGNVLLAGFSIGGSMTSYVACAEPGLFAAYAPVAGGMWRPQPETCAGPVKLLHTHGWSDDVVPLEGRAVRGVNARAPDAFVQGDVFASLDIWRETNGCANHAPDRRHVGKVYWTRVWTGCAEGSALAFALHPGGHSVPRGWAKMALGWFQTGALPQ